MSSPAEAGQSIDTEQLLRDREHLRLLLEVNNALMSNHDIHQLVRVVSVALSRMAPNDYCSLCLYDERTREFRVHALDFPGGKGLIRPEHVFPAEGSLAGQAFTKRTPLVVDNIDKREFPSDITRRLLNEGIRSACLVPLLHGERCTGVMCVGNREPICLLRDRVPLLSAVATQVAIAVENALVFQEISGLKDKLAKEKRYLEGEIRADYREMVGDSPEWQRVMQQIETVAPTNATVLVLGETGTGKELIARAIHNRSSRREQTFVKLNCSAVPGGLLESELFGHEKGAFTGAISQQLGRFELAHKGTLLLDEIGDIPLELQPKLLRALQEQQFERLGNPRTLKVDVRVIASTNRNLLELVRQRQFRDDLYYRLNVFPIIVPPLRERRADIPSLVRHFVQKHAERMRRRIDHIPPEAIETLMQGDWPGNVRELENLIERAVILSNGNTLHLPTNELQHPASTTVTSLQRAERDWILFALRECHGVVGGPDGAAARLGLKRTTLNSRMKKLGITRHDTEG